MGGDVGRGGERGGYKACGDGTKTKDGAGGGSYTIAHVILEDTRLNEVSQLQKDKHCMIPLIQGTYSPIHRSKK